MTFSFAKVPTFFKHSPPDTGRADHFDCTPLPSYSAPMRAELFSGPLCQLDDKSGMVRLTMSFIVYECDGRLLELAWEDTVPQENGKVLGGASRVLAREEAAPAGFELRLPLALFLAPRRVDFRLRMMEPLRSLGRGHGCPRADSDDLPGSVHLDLDTWVDVS